MARRRREASVALMLAGLLIWAAHFGVVYGFTGLVCARPAWARLTIAGWGLAPFGITLVTLIAAAGILAVLLTLFRRVKAGKGAKRPAEPFLLCMGIGGAVLALIGMAWELLPALMFGTCR